MKRMKSLQKEKDGMSFRWNKAVFTESSMTQAEIKRAKRQYAGQVLAEYAMMLVFCAFFALSLFLLLAVFTQYGTRLIGLVSWEPNPPDRSQMEKIVSGTL